MTLQNRYNYLPYFWAMTSFLKVLTHAKNIDNHWSSAVIHYFECMVRKTFYSCFLWLRNKKVINFQIFHTLFQKKCWPQQKLWYLAKNVPTIWCRPVWSFFVHNFVTIEQKIKKWTRRGGSPMDPFPPTYLTSKKPNSCSVNEAGRCKPCGGNSSSCQLCGNYKNTSVFESKYCNQVYQTKENFKCNSKMVVYLIECRVFRNHNGSTGQNFVLELTTINARIVIFRKNKYCWTKSVTRNVFKNISAKWP